MTEGRAKRFSCPVTGNPAPNIKWYKASELSGAPISNEKELEARETGCYTCLASNLFGTSVSITQCLIVGKSAIFDRLRPFCTDQQSQNLIGIGTFFPRSNGHVTK